MHEKTLAALLKSLEHPELKVIDLSLDRIHRYMEFLGNPHVTLPPVIHVAGTNGKGSTIAFLRSILEQAGYRYHAFTSPHLVRFNERIVVAGEDIRTESLLPILQDIRANAQGYPLTFFEANMVAAVQAFTETPADFTLLEVGMGGQFDATNIIPRPALTVITPVSMDHCEYLGDSIAKIAYEKACIIKTGRPCIMAPQEPEAEAVIREVAQLKNSELIAAAMLSLPYNLQGEHQRINASTAVAAAKALTRQGYTIGTTAIEHGLMHAHWRGRLQQLTQGELVDNLPENWQLWLDGGHNESAAQAIARWITHQDRPVHLICAMSVHKDAQAFLLPLKSVAESLHVIEIPNEALSMSARTLSEHANRIEFKHKIAKSTSEAIADCWSENPQKSAIILICGSLYLAGTILEKNS